MNEENQSVIEDKKTKEKKQKVAGGMFFVLFILFWIVFNFLTGLILALIGAIATMKTLEKKPEIQKFVPATFVVLVTLIFGAIFLPAIQSDKEFRSEKDEILSGTSQTHNYLTQAGTPERNIELGALRALGHDIEIRKIETSDGELWIDYVAKENLSTNLTRRGILSDTKDLVKELSSIVGQDVNAIVVEPHLTLVDQFGEESLSRVALITIERETWEKINWNNFLTDNLPDIADSYWLHPALSE
ncbi:MAG: hypothetical protein COV70_03370 [Parcubacteria group bacterium CG11_big_fil_rev_8_21_14_0_20_39_22]|nr:MAG: hypothetical protein COV70_03370 [Parcubacteria group bacterium CG11_big_fil_rev_8_21_14_0_20_39_22]